MDGIKSGHARKDALVVEDNALIAMEMEESLRDLGWPAAHVCGSVDHALELLDTYDVDFAVLDIHLGPGETCEAVAEILLLRGTPFVFASGYDHQPGLCERFPDAPILVKPFAPNDMEEALRTLGVL